MKTSTIPLGLPDGIEGAAWLDTLGQKGNRLTVEISAAKGCPIGAKDFATVLARTIKVLDAIEKDGGRKPPFWSVIELAVIGDRAVFALAAYDPEVVKEAQKKAKEKPCGA
jgi:hypothetical protein